MTDPIGIFVHHQGRGHAERAGALANAFDGRRPVTLFSARDDIFPPLGTGVELVRIPSLFEARGGEPPRLASHPTPDHLHCAPLGWRQIGEAVATITGWFANARPALFVTDVSAELGQLARIASVPHVAVLQHGDRGDPGHMASYRGAVGLLAPYAATLEQPDRPDWMRAKTHYAGGIGVEAANPPDKQAARNRLGLPRDREIVLVVAGGGGAGTPTAPLTIGARSNPEQSWIAIGETASEWHETPPGNLTLAGWVDDPASWIAAADIVVSSCGNTTVHMVANTAKPWIVVPEWRYFAEQYRKAEALDRAGVAAVAMHWPSHENAWRDLIAQSRKLDPANRTGLVAGDAADKAALWLDRLAANIWAGSALFRPETEREST